MWLPANTSDLQVTADVSIESLPIGVRQSMGPIVVRGLWYPFACGVGVTGTVDA
jgi:hypothetical protein